MAPRPRPKCQEALNSLPRRQRVRFYRTVFARVRSLRAIGFISGDISENIVAIVAAAGIMLVFGDRMVRSLPHCRTWGMRLAALAFVDKAFLQRDSDTNGVAHASFAGLVAGLLTLGPAWILLSILDFAAGVFGA